MLISAGVVLLAATAGAQEFMASTTNTTRSEQTRQSGTFDLKLNKRTDGAVVRVIDSGAPLQMINPDARAEYGSGEDLVQPDPIAKQPVGATGIILFGIRF